MNKIKVIIGILIFLLIGSVLFNAGVGAWLYIYGIMHDANFPDIIAMFSVISAWGTFSLIGIPFEPFLNTYFYYVYIKGIAKGNIYDEKLGYFLMIAVFSFWILVFLYVLFSVLSKFLRNKINRNYNNFTKSFSNTAKYYKNNRKIQNISSLTLDDLPNTKKQRLEKESSYSEKILDEYKLNKQIQFENPDYITTPDGSYPNYYNQKYKVMFIGREDRGLAGDDYNDTLLYAYKNKSIEVKNGTKTPNELGVHRKCLKYSYGLQNDFEFSDIPNANILCDKLGTDFSFAYVNESKASNLSENSQHLGVEQYNTFLSRNLDHNYLKKQISILSPSIIICQNINLKSISNLGEIMDTKELNGSIAYKIKIDNNLYTVINNSCHFSASKIKDSDEYETIRELSKF